MAEPDIEHFTSASAFVAALRRSDPRWLSKGEWQCQWIFRGQPCETFTLLPRAWRKEAKDHRIYKQLAEDAVRSGHAASMNRPNLDIQIQARFEFIVFMEFCKLANELGLPIPGGSLPDESDGTIPGSRDPHPALAMAQHHGTPTKLLDWTYNPLIAAFFAADTAKEEDPGNIAVWALNQLEPHTGNYRRFTVPRSQIGFLHSQEALFTYIPRAGSDFFVSGQWPHLEKVLPPSLLRLLTLPKKEVPELRRLLSAERISRAHLMPTLDNVTKALENVWDGMYGPVTATINPSTAGSK